MASAGRQDIVHEGWLTKSPPSKRVWKPKWRRRWFTLRQSKELPAQFFLDYYADKNGQKLKGSINLDLCEQIDAGLRMQRRNRDDSTSKGSVFSIRTQNRTYHLQADCVTDMEKWVEVICRACGLYSTDEKFFMRGPENVFRTSSQSTPSLYIPISECITGPPSKYKEQNGVALYMNCSSTIMCGYFNKNVENNFVTNKTYEGPSKITKISESNAENSLAEEFSQTVTLSGPNAPPRPPKPSHLAYEATQKDSFVGPRLNEPPETSSNTIHNCGNNVHAPTIDRKLKPRHLHTYQLCYENLKKINSSEDLKCLNLDLVSSSGSDGRLKNPKENSSTLQYLDLDLVPPSAASVSKCYNARAESNSSTNYKTVDFLKTKALNMTRAEACRRNDVPFNH